MASAAEKQTQTEAAVDWPRDSGVTELNPVDIACIGASSGGFLSFSGSEAFPALVRSRRTIRLIEAGTGFGGDMSRYGILGNTVCNDHIAGLDHCLWERLENVPLAREFAKNRWVSPRLRLVGQLFEHLGHLMVERLGPRLDARFRARVLAVQWLDDFDFRVFCSGPDSRFWFSARAVYLATGARGRSLPKEYSDLDPQRLVDTLDAVTPEGIRHIKDLAAREPNSGIHIIGSSHTAAALLSTFGLTSLQNAAFTPRKFYSIDPATIAKELSHYPAEAPKITVWARTEKERRIVLRADKDDDARRLARDKRYRGPIYRSRFEDKENGRRIYNSHNALETPHAECILALRDPELATSIPRFRYRISENSDDYLEQLRQAPVVINATGIEPRMIPFFGPDGKERTFDSPLTIAMAKRQAVLTNGKTIEGLYLNGVCGQLTAAGVLSDSEDLPEEERVPDPFLEGDGSDLDQALALGVLQSREEGAKDIRKILDTLTSIDIGEQSRPPS